MRVLGLDVGTKTLGVAMSDSGQMLAQACEVLVRRGEAHDVTAIVARVAQHDVGVVVVGLPLELDGSRGHRVRLVERFVRALTSQLEPMGVTLETWDERFSTAAAERTLIEGGLSRARRKARVDAVAAQFLLQGWLDARRRTSRVTNS